MAGVTFKVDIDLSALEKLASNLQGFSVRYLLDNVGELVEEQTKKRIDSEKTNPKGKSWPTRKDNKAHPLLENTHRLFGSISYQVKEKQVEVGTNVEYAATHQYGDNRSITRRTKSGSSRPYKRNIPSRAFLGLSKDNKTEINALVRTYIEDLKQGT